MNSQPPAVNRAERGRTAREVLFAIGAIAGLALGLWAVTRRGISGGPSQPPKAPVGRSLTGHPAYKAITTPDGLIPMKAVVIPPAGAVVYRSADAGSSTSQRLPMFNTYFPMAREGGFLRLGNDPMVDASIGWVRVTDVLLWATREAIRPNIANPKRQLLRLWDRREDVGNASLVRYQETGNDPASPYPILETRDGSLRIALPWQSSDYNQTGVATAWTPKLTIPDDARIYFMSSRAELQRHLEEFNQALHDIDSGAHAEHPIVVLLRNSVQTTVGGVAEEEDPGLLRRILRDLHVAMRITDEQPEEMRRDSEKMRRQWRRLKSFYQSSDNWDERGVGWIPSEYLPGS